MAEFDITKLSQLLDAEGISVDKFLKYFENKEVSSVNDIINFLKETKGQKEIDFDKKIASQRKEKDKYIEEIYNIRLQKNREILPLINIYEDDVKYCIDAVIPGVTKDKICVSIVDDELLIDIDYSKFDDIYIDKYMNVYEFKLKTQNKSIKLENDIDENNYIISFENSILHIELNKIIKQPISKKLSIK